MSARQVDRRNRVRFVIIGLVLIALGVCGLLLRAGVLVLPEPSELYDQVAQLASPQPLLTIAVFVLVGLLLVVLGIRLLTQQISTPGARVGELALTQNDRGRTTVGADVVSKALTRDLERQPGVEDASARVVSIGPKPRVVVRASIDGEADLPRVRAAMEEPFERVSRVLGTTDVSTFLHVKPVAGQRTRVS